jgi:anti-anti-sigma factor
MVPNEAMLRQSIAEDIVFLELRGEWELSNVDRLMQAFEQIAPGHDVLIDLRELEYCDSSVLTAIVALQRRMRPAGRRVEVVLQGSRSRRIFEVTHLDKLLEVSPQRFSELESIKDRASAAAQ